VADPDIARGVLTDFVDSENGFPARFKVGSAKCKVWPIKYQSDEVNGAYEAAKRLAQNSTLVEVRGKEERKAFTPKGTAKKIWVTEMTVYEIEALEVDPNEDGLTPLLDIPSSVIPRKSGTEKSGLTKQEWAQKDREKKASIDAWAALKISVQGLVGNNKEVTDDAVERNARMLIQIAHRLEAEMLSPTYNSGSATSPESPPKTTEPVEQEPW
jgi:hypothetical protein